MATYIGKVKVDGTNELPVASTLYGTCSTATGTLAKVVVCANFDKLITGVAIAVKFTVANTADGTLTLNVNSTGAKTIYYRGAALARPNNGLLKGVCLFVYDGTYWHLLGDYIDTNTDTLVTQTNTTTSADYRVLLSYNANDTTQTVGARKSSKLIFNPSTGRLTVGADPTSALQVATKQYVDNASKQFKSVLNDSGSSSVTTLNFNDSEWNTEYVFTSKYYTTFNITLPSEWPSETEPQEVRYLFRTASSGTPTLTLTVPNGLDTAGFSDISLSANKYYELSIAVCGFNIDNGPVLGAICKEWTIQ